jgi:hypothetical protein
MVIVERGIKSAVGEQGDYPSMAVEGNAKGRAFLAQKRKQLAQNGNLRRKKDPRNLQGTVQDHADILDLRPGKILEDRDKVKQLVVVSVREPATDGNRVLRMEDVRGGGVVNDDRLLQVTTDL